MKLETVNDYIEAKLTHSIHTSGAKSFRGCRRRWDWLMREFWYPKTTAKPLEFGVSFHKAAEVLYDPTLWDKPSLVVEQVAYLAFAKSCKEQRARYEESFGQDPKVDKDYNERLTLGKGMISYWVANGRKQDIDNGFKPLQVEIPFEVPISNVYCKCKTCWDRYTGYVKTIYHDQFSGSKERYQSWLGLPVTYGGRIDCIMEGADSRVWIVDWKTCTTLSEDAEYLLLDDQISRYCAAMKILGYRMAGFIYHEQRKAFPQEPEPLNRRYMGKLYSTNRQQAVELHTYRQTVKENDPVAFQEGLYDDYFDFLEANPNRFSNRFTVYRNDRELDQVWQTVRQETLDQIDPNVRIYPNPGRFHCKTCAFRQPCLEANSQGDVLYTLSTLFDKRRYHYYEDKVPSTESKGNE